MNEVKLKSELMALGMTMQFLVAKLSNNGLIDLVEMHDKLTDTVIHTLQQPAFESDLAKQIETEGVAFLDRLFSNATRTAAALRDAEGRSDG